MTATLTERYIAAAVSSIPPANRDDVRAELDVSIADAIEARTANGEAATAAERAVLNDLGDPGELAAGYTDRPLHLIGPRFYLTWWRLLKLLWIIVPVTAMGGAALGQFLDDAPLNTLIGSAVVTGLTAFIHVAFWVTLVFVALERTGSTSALADWDVDRLPEIRPKGAGLGEMITALAFLVIGAVVIFWDQFSGLVILNGQAFPFLSPGLWPWWITGLLVLMAAQTSIVIAVYLAKRWTPAFALINTALALAFAIPATMLLVNGQLVNPEFITAVLIDNGVQDDSMRVLAFLAGAGIVGFSAWGILDGWLKAIRDNRH